MTILIAVVLWVAAYAAAIGASVYRRTSAGANFRMLITSGLYELPALQGLLPAIWLAGSGALCFGSLMVLYSLSSSTNLRNSNVPAWPLALALLILGSLGVYLLKWIWMRLDAGNGPRVNIENVNIDDGIPHSEFAAIGLERFPSETSPHRWRELTLRRIVICVAGGSLVFILLVTVGALDYPSSSLVERSLRLIGMVNSGVLLAILGAGLPLTYLMVFGDRNYRMLGTLTHLGLFVGLSFTVALCAASIRGTGAEVPPFGNVTTFVGLIFACTAGLIWRYLSDLRVARNYRKAMQARGHLEVAFEGCTTDLDAIAQSNQLPKMTLIKLRERLEYALQREESKSRLVTRGIGRLMRIVGAAAAQCAAIEWKFLIVSRKLARNMGRSVQRQAHRTPSVALWDFEQYPLIVPEGYDAPCDPHRIELPPEFNIVQDCGNCGGSGSVWVTEHYTETEWDTDFHGHTQSRSVSRSRQVQETCGSCKGTGTLLFRQIIVTKWRAHAPTVLASPPVPNDSISNRTTECVYLKQPMYEDFALAVAKQRVLRTAECIFLPLQRIASRASAVHSEHAGLVAKQYKGRVYRSELVIKGFHTFRIRYEGLRRGAVIWLFGDDAECQLRQVPHSKSVVTAIAVLPPLAVIGIISGAALVIRFFTVMTQ